jgi:hypothetical protein
MGGNNPPGIQTGLLSMEELPQQLFKMMGIPGIEHACDFACADLHRISLLPADI